MNGAGGPELANEVGVEVALRSVTLRNFTYVLAPLRSAAAELVATVQDADELQARLEGVPVDGLELRVMARDTGLYVSLRFERGEFVNLATAGLQVLDRADATELPRGGENA